MVIRVIQRIGPWLVRMLPVMTIGFSILTTLPSWAEEIRGPVAVRDDAIIRIGDQPVRLYGVAIPTSDAWCESGTRPWPCGERALSALTEHIRGEFLHCDVKGDAGHNNTGESSIVVCRLSDGRGEILNAWLVGQGWALASAADRGPYADLETRAREDGLGLWRDGFNPPEAWRADAIDTVLAVLGSGDECDICALRRSRPDRNLEGKID